jgi:hypothetical protein
MESGRKVQQRSLAPLTADLGRWPIGQRKVFPLR